MKATAQFSKATLSNRANATTPVGAKLSRAMHDNRPRLTAQRQLQSAADTKMRAGTYAPVIQGYFIKADGKHTHTEYPSTADSDRLWNEYFVPELTGILSAALQSKYKEDLIKAGQNSKRLHNIREIVERIYDTERGKEKLANSNEPIALGSPIEDWASPRALPKVKLVKRECQIGSDGQDKEKHSTAEYQREGSENTKRIELDEFTKGQAREERKAARKGDAEQVAEAQPQATYLLKTLISDKIKDWDCTSSLARYLAHVVWPMLPNTEEGQFIELIIREMDDAVAKREKDYQASSIIISADVTNKKCKDAAPVEIERKTCITEARKLLKKALGNGENSPSGQNDVPFIQDVIKRDYAKVGTADWLKPNSFNVNKGFSSNVSFGMSIVHWQTIILFDWMIATKILKTIHTWH